MYDNIKIVVSKLQLNTLWLKYLAQNLTCFKFNSKASCRFRTVRDESYENISSS